MRAGSRLVGSWGVLDPCPLSGGSRPRPLIEEHGAPSEASPDRSVLGARREPAPALVTHSRWRLDMVQVTVGVDTGKARHQAAAYDPAAERIVGQVSFSVDRAGFDHVRGFLERLRPQPDQVVIGPEATGHYHLTLVEYLVSLGYRVALLNPLRAAQFRRSQGKRAKTDRLDAQALARSLAVRAPRPQPVPSQALVELRELTRFRAELVGQRTTVLHQLIGAVDLAFPELPRLLGDLRGRTGSALLARYPSASAIAAADPQRLTELLHQASRGHFGPTRVARLLATARARVAVRQTAAVLGLK